MNDPETHVVEEQLVRVPAGPTTLEGNLTLPEEARAVVLFATAAAAAGTAPQSSCGWLPQRGEIGDLLIDLLTPHEEVIDARTALLRFDIDLLAKGSSM